MPASSDVPPTTVVVIFSMVTALTYHSASDAKETLFNVAAQLEQYYQDNKGYPAGGDMSDLGYGAATFVSLEEYYTIGFNGAPTTTTYSIQAVPRGDQVNDTACATFRLNHLEQKSVTGTSTAARCW